MRFINIASSSSGNATYIGSDNTHILVDAGISKVRILRALHDAELDLSDITAVLITHEHTDHVSGLGTIARAANIPIYATEGTIRKIKSNGSLGHIDDDLFFKIESTENFLVGDIKIQAVPIMHDAAEPVCYRFDCGQKSAAIVTDLGIYDDCLINKLKDLDFLMIEANHDIRMLEAGPYPYPLKMRISGCRGHLSNEASGKLICELLNDKVRSVLLAHLSRHNNTSDLAKLAVCNEIDFAANKYKSDDFEIIAAKHDEYTRVLL